MSGKRDGTENRVVLEKTFCSTSMETLAAWDAARTNGALLKPEGSQASAGNFRYLL
jgi:hypothetical protein